MSRLLLAVALLGSGVLAQNSAPTPSAASVNPSSSVVSSQMSGEIDDMAGRAEGADSAMRAIEGHGMDMGLHTKRTSLRAAQPGDQEKGDQVVRAVRTAAAKYQDYKVALADGYNVPAQRPAKAVPLH